MSLRARMRRDRKYKAKLKKREETQIIHGERVKEDGGEEGKVIALAGSALILHNEFGLGALRIAKVLDICSDHCEKADSIGIKYFYQKYKKEIYYITGATGISNKKFMEIFSTGNYTEQDGFNQARDDSFRQIQAVFCMALSECGYSQNSKKNGRMDRFLKCVAELWVEYHLMNYDSKHYQEKCREFGLKL